MTPEAPWPPPSAGLLLAPRKHCRYRALHHVPSRASRRHDTSRCTAIGRPFGSIPGRKPLRALCGLPAALRGMPGDRRMRIIARLFPRGDSELGNAHLCQVCADITDMTGAGIMLMSGETPQGSACTSNDVSAQIEELQYTLGEGPCIDAYHQERVVLEPDLANPMTTRWVGFTAPAVRAGVRAVFGFPLQVGSVRLGALNLYRDRPGSLSDEQHADGLVVADVAAHAVLVMQANAPPGSLAPELESDTGMQSVVYQASGMVAVQLGVSVAQALIRLRAYSFANDQRLADVAHDVVHRRLRFDGSSS